MRVIEKPCPPGKWRFEVASDLRGNSTSGGPSPSGHYWKLEGVYLKGLRRAHPLNQVDKKTFFEIHPPNPETGLPQDQEFVVRGVPTMWTHMGMYIYLHPAPLHDWTLQVRLVPK